MPKSAPTRSLNLESSPSSIWFLDAWKSYFGKDSRQKSDSRLVGINEIPLNPEVDSSTQRVYCDNSIKSTKYTILNFSMSTFFIRSPHNGDIHCLTLVNLHFAVPLFLFFQFTRYEFHFFGLNYLSRMFLTYPLLGLLYRLANLYFLLVCILQCFPSISTTSGVPTTAVPLGVVILFDMLITAREEYHRYLEDKKANSSGVEVYRVGSGSSFIEMLWSEVRVGDIVKVRRSCPIPADLLFLGTNNPDPETRHISYVETSQLDGESTLKLRSANTRVASLATSDRACMALGGSLVCDEPSPHFNRFNGVLKITASENSAHLDENMTAEQELSIPVDPNMLLLRGCTLRNVDVAYGLVVYTGEECKVRVAQAISSPKKSSIEREINRIILLLLIFQIFLCVMGAVGYAIWTRSNWQETWYLMLTRPTVGDTVERFFTLFQLLSYLIPISLYVTVKVTRTIQAAFMNKDLLCVYINEDERKRVLEELNQESVVVGGFSGDGKIQFASEADKEQWEKRAAEAGVYPLKVRTLDLNDELGQVTHIFTDKTGTLTTNYMEFRKLCVGGVSYGLGTTDIGRSRRLRRELSRQISLAHVRHPVGVRTPTADYTAPDLLMPLVSSPVHVGVTPPAQGDPEQAISPPLSRAEQRRQFLRNLPSEVALSVNSAPAAGALPRQPTVGSLEVPAELLKAVTALPPAAQNLISSLMEAEAPSVSGANGAPIEHVNFQDGCEDEPGRRLLGPSGDAVQRSSHAALVRLMLLQLALNHTAILEDTPSGQRLSVSSPDEEAFIRAAELFGKRFAARSRGVTQVMSRLQEGLEEPEQYRVVAVLPYTQARKMMSVLIEDLQFEERGSPSAPVRDPGSSDRSEKKNRTRLSSATSVDTAEHPLSPASSPGGPQRASTAQTDLNDEEAMLDTQKLESGFPSRFMLFSKGADSKIFSILRELDESELADPADPMDKSVRQPGPSSIADDAVRPYNIHEVDSAVTRASTARYMADWAADGLRTLCFAGKYVPEEAARAWIARYEHAQTDLAAQRAHAVGAESPLSQLSRAMESRLTLFGATANEDKLQEQVPETIGLLSQAGIKVVMLTGDKQETALNIASATRMLSEEFDLHSFAVENIEVELQQQHSGSLGPLEVARRAAILCRQRVLQRAREMAENTRLGLQRTGPVALVLDEGAIDALLTVESDSSQPLSTTVVTGIWRHWPWRRNPTPMDSPETPIEALLYLIEASDSVICCRCRPDQKKKIVRLVRRGNRSAVTLAIGDGANDVDMINEAHVGVGIAGAEGVQAANASDFSIGRFRFLKRLLLVHGRWNYSRMARVIQYSFWKNVLFALAQVCLVPIAAWSGQRFILESVNQTFNLIYTGPPIVVTGVLDQDVPSSAAEAYPTLYDLGRLKKLLTMRSVVFHLLDAIIQGGLLILFVWLVVAAGGQRDGVTPYLFLAGVYVFTAVVVVVTVRVAYLTYSHNRVFQWILAICALLLVPVWFITDATDADNCKGCMEHAFSDGNFYFFLLWIAAFSIIHVFTFEAFRRAFYPSLIDLVRENEYILKDQEKERRRQKALDRQSYPWNRKDDDKDGSGAGLNSASSSAGSRSGGRRTNLRKDFEDEDDPNRPLVIDFSGSSHTYSLGPRDYLGLPTPSVSRNFSFGGCQRIAAGPVLQPAVRPDVFTLLKYVEDRGFARFRSSFDTVSSADTSKSSSSPESPEEPVVASLPPADNEPPIQTERICMPSGEDTCEAAPADPEPKIIIVASASPTNTHTESLSPIEAPSRTLSEHEQDTGSSPVVPVNALYEKELNYLVPPVPSPRTRQRLLNASTLKILAYPRYKRRSYLRRKGSLSPRMSDLSNRSDANEEYIRIPEKMVGRVRSRPQPHPDDVAYRLSLWAPRVAASQRILALSATQAPPTSVRTTPAPINSFAKELELERERLVRQRLLDLCSHELITVLDALTATGASRALLEERLGRSTADSLEEQREALRSSRRHLPVRFASHSPRSLRRHARSHEKSASQPFSTSGSGMDSDPAETRAFHSQIWTPSIQMDPKGAQKAPVSVPPLSFNFNAEEGLAAATSRTSARSRTSRLSMVNSADTV